MVHEFNPALTDREAALIAEVVIGAQRATPIDVDEYEAAADA